MSKLVLPNNEIPNIKMVIFDKDGTLIDIHNYWCSMIEFRAQFFVEAIKDEVADGKKLFDDLVNNMGIDLETRKMKPEGPVGIKPRAFIKEVALQTLKQYTDRFDEQAVDNVFATVDEFSKGKLKEIVKPLDGVFSLLENLKESGVMMTIATTDLTPRAQLAMQELGLDHYFVDIVGADLVKNAKPATDIVDFILDKYKLDKANVVVIGDSTPDMEMALNVGCPFIGVRTGLLSESFVQGSEILLEGLGEVKVESNE